MYVILPLYGLSIPAGTENDAFYRSEPENQRTS